MCKKKFEEKKERQAIKVGESRFHRPFNFTEINFTETRLIKT